jgi:hypothetical protein
MGCARARARVMGSTTMPSQNAESNAPVSWEQLSPTDYSVISHTTPARPRPRGAQPAQTSEAINSSSIEHRAREHGMCMWCGCGVWSVECGATTHTVHTARLCSRAAAR